MKEAPSCFIQDFHTGTLRVEYHDRQHLFGMRLKPHAVRSLLGIMPPETNNQAIDLTLINPRFRRLWHQLIEAPSFEERVRLVEGHFSPKYIKKCSRTEHLGNLFQEDNLHLLVPKEQNKNTLQTQALDTVNALAERICFSTRHLNRKSKELFGFSAEELIRYKKFVNAIELMHRDRYSLSEVAHQSGFYDQSHFIRVFKYYASMTPKAYQQVKGALPFHLFT